MAEQQTIGRYKIVAELGHGAMGAVYRAEDPMMDRTVAIKTILAAALTGPLAQEYRERFIREAKAAGRLSHPGIVTVYDVSEENGTPYLVMEFINGRSLAAAMDSGERFSIDRIYELGQQIAEALGYAHRNGVVHRDVKPANILLATPAPGETERAKLADLGVAKLTATQITTTGQLLGTPAFMPPEQFTGVPIDGRADLFSLGVILYWIATGDKPFAGDTITAVSYKIVHSDPSPPRRINPAVPVALERIIMKCLEKDPAARYMTGESLAADLAAGRAGRELMQSGGVVAQRSTANAVLMPVANMSGDPNTTLDSTQRLQMAAAAPAPPAVVPPPPAASKSAKRLETPALIGIGLAVVTLLVAGIFLVKFFQHQRQLRAEQQAQAQATAQTQAPPQDLFAQAQPAQTDTSAGATADQNAAQTGQQAIAQPPNGSAASDGSSNPMPAMSMDAGKKPSSKTPSNRTPKKQNSSSQPAGNADAFAPPPVTPAQTPQPQTNAAPPTTAPTTPASSAPAPAASNPPQQQHAAKPEIAASADMAKLHIEDGSVPNSASFIVLMDGKQLFERKPVAEGAAAPKEDDLPVPPGDHEFRVLTGTGGPQVTTSSKVKEKFFAKKKMILKIELRDSTTGKTLKKNSHLDSGKTEFLISVKAANLLGF
jgi:serine/threonine protein kinase